MKVSKVVLVVVALHVLVIGGIFVFEGCSRSHVQAPDMASTSDDMSIPASTNATTTTTPTPTGPDVARLTPQPIPAAGPTGVAAIDPVAPVAPARTYVVKSKDTLTKIAKAEKISVGELAKANNLTKTAMLKIGQKLTIPSAAPAVATATPLMAGTAPVSTPIAGSAYEVKSGDSLWKIAKANNTTVTAIKQANSLTKESLQVGQKLTIPAATAVASTGGTLPAAEPAMGASAVSNGQTVHVVNIGEYPATIAKKYGVKVEDLLKANNITDARKVRAGAKLVIPVAATPVAAPVTPAVTTPVTPAVPAATVSSAPIATASAN